MVRRAVEYHGARAREVRGAGGVPPAGGRRTGQEHRLFRQHIAEVGYAEYGDPIPDALNSLPPRTAKS